MKAPLYNQTGEKKGEVTLSKNVFEIEGGEGLVQRYVVFQRASKRMPIAHTKTKGEVRGGGKKPFAQKHTGQARQGSIKNPHMHGGGVVFGPKSWQNFALRMPKAMRQRALFQILSSKAADNKILVLDKFELETPKTKTLVELLKKIGVERKALILMNKDEKPLQLSARNAGNAKPILVGNLNAEDLLNHKFLLFTETALKELEKTYSK
ncbi:MAG: 50S ribosomal protein L4 [Candidatus Gracilibacteria bacterium]|jgi:large subunit ribosomal protein L4